jgi:hypothetical protein
MLKKMLIMASILFSPIYGIQANQVIEKPFETIPSEQALACDGCKVFLASAQEESEPNICSLNDKDENGSEFIAGCGCKGKDKDKENDKKPSILA